MSFVDTLIQFLIFGVIGAWNTFFDFALFWIFLNLGKKTPTKIKSKIKKIKTTQNFIHTPTIAHLFSFTIANIVSFYLNTHFTFRDGKTNPSFLSYFLVTLFSLGISTLLIQLFTDDFYYKKFEKKFLTKIPEKIREKIDFDEKKWALLVKLGTVAVTLITNFVGYKFFVF